MKSFELRWKEPLSDIFDKVFSGISKGKKIRNL